jgi:hypothetical protein
MQNCNKIVILCNFYAGYVHEVFLQPLVYTLQCCKIAALLKVKCCLGHFELHDILPNFARNISQSFLCLNAPYFI